MRLSIGVTLAVLWLAAPTAVSARGAPEAAVEAIDKAGETAATEGAPGTVVPDTPGVAVAPGIQAPVETPMTPSNQPRGDAPASK